MATLNIGSVNESPDVNNSVLVNVACEGGLTMIHWPCFVFSFIFFFLVLFVLFLRGIIQLHGQ